MVTLKSSSGIQDEYPIEHALHKESFFFTNQSTRELFNKPVNNLPIARKRTSHTAMKKKLASFYLRRRPSDPSNVRILVCGGKWHDTKKPTSYASRRLTECIIRQRASCDCTIHTPGCSIIIYEVPERSIFAFVSRTFKAMCVFFFCLCVVVVDYDVVMSLDLRCATTRDMLIVGRRLLPCLFYLFVFGRCATIRLHGSSKSKTGDRGNSP